MLNSKAARYVLGILMFVLALAVPFFGYFLNQPSSFYALFIWVTAVFSFAVGVTYLYVGAKHLDNSSLLLSLKFGFSVFVVIGVNIIINLMRGSSGAYGEIYGPISTVSSTVVFLGLLVALVLGFVGVIQGGKE